LRDVSITGVGITEFGKFPDASTAVAGHRRDPGRDRRRRAHRVPDHRPGPATANCVAGLLTGQESIRGQVVVLRQPALGGKPLINTSRTACATQLQRGAHRTGRDSVRYLPHGAG